MHGTVLHVIPEDWFFWSHRHALARATVAAGARVVVAARFTNHLDRVREAGFGVVRLGLRRESRNPVNELAAVHELYRLYRTIKPTVVHQTTIKPVLYGSLAAWLAGSTRVVNGVSGLGHVFVATGLRAALVRVLVKCAYASVAKLLGKRAVFVFENTEDREKFVGWGLVDASQAEVVFGMGCDVNRFTPTEMPAGVVTVMFAGRLLLSKGIGELAAAAAVLRHEGQVLRIVLVGSPDPGNPESVSEEQLRAWVQEGLLEWWGAREDMPAVLSQSHIVILPSKYGEGLPKILLEAAACGRALIASNIPGCTEIVRDEVTGVLVEPGSVDSLVAAIRRLAGDRAALARMGVAGRELVVRGFSDQVVNDRTLAIYQRLCSQSSTQ